MSNIFAEDDEFQIYQNQMEDFLCSVPKNEEYSIADRSALMQENMSTNSKDWVKSFESVGSGQSMSIEGSSLRQNSSITSRGASQSKLIPPSDASLVSELTDLSAGLRSMGLEKK